MRKIFCLFVLALFATGCATPEVTLQNALLTKLTQKDLEVGLDLQIFNPNEFTIPLIGVDWDLDLFKADFTKGQTDFARQIPAQRRADVRVPIGISFQTIRAGAESLLTKRQIPWQIGGGCHFRIPGTDNMRIGFQKAGQWQNPLFQ